MARLVALYKTPKDLTAFDRYYFSTHIPLAKTIPGLRKYEISDGGVHSPGGPSGYHLVAILHFGSVNANFWTLFRPLHAGCPLYEPAMRLIFAAMMKSFSCNPFILCVCSETAA
ncbi:EthD family reductase [Mesorhizobium calcicola]|uniref:EthD family reductase n=1 Tax=Mesorhizobium calcicola TaxID=1300310 RepID=A0ABW4WJ47_9HYPH